MTSVERMSGRTVRVGEDLLDARDVIEVGEALIERDGWLQRDSGDAARGWSLHGAIGEAAKRLGEHGTGHDKGGPVARPLRDAATKLLEKVLPDGETEFTFNDKADDADAVIALMRAARGA